MWCFQQSGWCEEALEGELPLKRKQQQNNLRILVSNIGLRKSGAHLERSTAKHNRQRQLVHWKSTSSAMIFLRVHNAPLKASWAMVNGQWRRSLRGVMPWGQRRRKYPDGGHNTPGGGVTAVKLTSTVQPQSLQPSASDTPPPGNK